MIRRWVLSGEGLRSRAYHLKSCPSLLISQGQCCNNVVGSVAVSVWRRVRWLWLFALSCSSEFWSGFHQDVPPKLHGLYPLGLRAHRCTRDTEKESFLLETP